MSETVRTLDARTSTDADGNSYYVVFCSRNSDNVTTKPGHAFVVWGVEDNQQQRSIQKAFGFYPDDNDESKAVFGNVGGQIKNEAFSLTSSNLLTARLIVRVNKQPFEASQAQIDAWRTTDYNLYAQNCIHFARSVAVTLGLFPPSVGVFQIPTSYLNQLIASTTRSEGGSGSSPALVTWSVDAIPNGHGSTRVMPDGQITSQLGLSGPWRGVLNGVQVRELHTLLDTLPLTGASFFPEGVMPNPLLGVQRLRYGGREFIWGGGFRPGTDDQFPRQQEFFQAPAAVNNVVAWLHAARANTQANTSADSGSEGGQATSSTDSLEVAVTISVRMKPRESSRADK